MRARVEPVLPAQEAGNRKMSCKPRLATGNAFVRNYWLLDRWLASDPLLAWQQGTWNNAEEARVASCGWVQIYTSWSGWQEQEALFRGKRAGARPAAQRPKAF